MRSPVTTRFAHTADDGEDAGNRRVRQPYDRSRQTREWVRMSLDYDLRQHDVYPRRKAS